VPAVVPSRCARASHFQSITPNLRLSDGYLNAPTAALEDITDRVVERYSTGFDQ
jgi:hypothetical protein